MATFILQKILLDETGLGYICHTYERFSHVAMILVSDIYLANHEKDIENVSQMNVCPKAGNE